VYTAPDADAVLVGVLFGDVGVAGRESSDGDSSMLLPHRLMREHIDERLVVDPVDCDDLAVGVEGRLESNGVWVVLPGPLSTLGRETSSSAPSVSVGVSLLAASSLCPDEP
jgi:hypothetical protein